MCGEISGWTMLVAWAVTASSTSASTSWSTARRPWPARLGAHFSQGYLDSAAGLSVRVRLVPDRGRFTITVKGARQGISRREAECDIEPDVAELLLEACGPHVIDKTRHTVQSDESVEWTIDVFHGANDGLVLAEVELAGEDVAVSVPVWCGAEVTDDDRYYNEYLTQHPFSTW